MKLKKTGLLVTNLIIIYLVCGFFTLNSHAATQGWQSENGQWCYYSSNGKKAVSKWLTLGDEKYYFDADGYMKTGWLDNQYYFGTDGVMKKGWVRTLTYHDAANGIEDKEENWVWLYFQTSGKLHDPDVNSDSVAVTKSVNGFTYAFGQYGAMKHGWVNVSESHNSADISDYKYFGDENDGTLKFNGWYYLLGPERINSQSADFGYNWYYLKSNGTPRTTEKRNGFEKSDLVTVDKQQYLFDEFGRAKYGLIWLDEELYYLGTADECIVKTGQYTLEDDAGLVSKYYFANGSSSKGKGYTGVYNGELYYKGLIQTANEEEIYKVVTISSEDSLKNYMVNTFGNVMKNSLITLNNGIKYKMNASGVVTAVDGDRIDSSYDSVGSEPIEANVRK